MSDFAMCSDDHDSSDYEIYGASMKQIINAKVEISYTGNFCEDDCIYFNYDSFICDLFLGNLECYHPGEVIRCSECREASESLTTYP